MPMSALEPTANSSSVKPCLSIEVEGVGHLQASTTLGRLAMEFLTSRPVKPSPQLSYEPLLKGLEHRSSRKSFLRTFWRALPICWRGGRSRSAESCSSAELTRRHGKLNGLVFPHPALIFKVLGKDLYVRAMATTSRPGPETPLKTAPYWNTDSRGLVCAGSMRVPESSDVASIPAYGDAYFQSEFTHAAGAVRLTSHPGGFIGLWRGLAGRKRFPVKYLIDAGETLHEFVARGDER
jgi:hypothetical protein